MNEIERKIYDEFSNSDVCMGELLADIEVPAGMTFEDAFLLYVKIMNNVEQDRFFRIAEEDLLEYVTIDDKVLEVYRHIGIY